MVIFGGVSKASTSARKEKEAVMRMVRDGQCGEGSDGGEGGDEGGGDGEENCGGCFSLCCGDGGCFDCC